MRASSSTLPLLRVLRRAFSVPPAAPPLPPAPASADTRPVYAAGSWGWDADSIQRRVSAPRRGAPLSPSGAPLHRTGLSIGAPTEEDAYIAAGAPGYEGVAAAQSADAAAAAAAAAARTAAAAAAAATAAAEAEVAAAAAPHFSAAPAPAPAQPLGRVVRLTRGIVPQKALTSFLSTWRLLALPVYEGLPGCLSARVLLGQSEDAAARSTSDAGPRGGLRTVVVATEWRSAEDLEALEAASSGGEGGGASSGSSSSSTAYAAAMRQLAQHFRGELSTTTLGQEAPHVFRRGA